MLCVSIHVVICYDIYKLQRLIELKQCLRALMRTISELDGFNNVFLGLDAEHLVVLLELAFLHHSEERCEHTEAFRSNRLVVLIPSSHPETSEDQVREDEGTGADHDGFLRHTAICDDGTTISHESTHVNGGSTADAVKTELGTSTFQACTLHECLDRALVSDDGFINHKISAKIHELATSGGEVRTRTDDIDSLEAQHTSDLNDGLTDATSSAVLHDHISLLKLDEVVDHSEGGTGVHHDGSDGFRGGNVIRDLEEIS